MSRIVLLRHGPVACDRPFLPDRAAFLDYCAAYEAAPLAPGRPPDELAKICKGVRLFASTAPRARETALRLAPRGDWRFDAIFAEEPMVAPECFGRWPIPVWFALARGRESWAADAGPQRQALGERAETAARQLSDAAPSLLVGHGWFNRAIAAALAAEGYRAAKPAPPWVVGRAWGAQSFWRTSCPQGRGEIPRRRWSCSGGAANVPRPSAKSRP